MITPEPTPADPHLNHDSSTDHPSYINTKRDTILKEPRTRETMSTARPPGSSYETGVTKNHRGKNLAPRAKGVKSLVDASAALASAEPKYFDEDGALTHDSLEEFLTREELDRLQLDPSVLPRLWDAQRDPPITKATLSELDLERFSTDPQLRHDVYIDRGVSFRPVVNSPTARLKRQQASWYWDALVIEFALHITRRKLAVQRSGHSCSMTSPWVRLTNPDWAPTRLPDMFRVIKEITKTLVPQLEWAIVDARLDVDLLVQELEQGVCDVNGLIGWLGTLLLGSCSPMRDSLVEEMVSTVQEGVNTANARVIVDGLRDLFGILEIMKLDVANHQLRILRLLMVEDCIRFQQNVFLHRMTREPRLKDAHSWFREPREPDYENPFSRFHVLLADRRDEVVRSDLAIFMHAVVDLVVSNSANFPPTFEYDVQRLHCLQAEFQVCVRMASYCIVFIEAAGHLGFIISPTREVCNNLTQQITDLTASLDAAVDSAAHYEAVTLHIVRQAYLYCGNDSLPPDSVLKEMERTLRRARNPHKIEFHRMQAMLFNDLYDLVEEQVISTINLNPWSVIDRLNPTPSDLYAPEEDVVILPAVARRLAHILVLHWRVWAPILYQQPSGRVPHQTSGEHSWLGTGGGSGGGFGDGFGGSGETRSFEGEERSMDIGANCDAKGVM